MRVVAGIAKGHTLRYPRTPRIRPTADLVRGAIFSALESLDIDWSSVLDLYAGTGALGIEALSRGAGEADFVEHNPSCCSIIRENLRHTGLSGRGKVYHLDVRRAIYSLGRQYSLIFLDPPYADRTNEAILGEVASSNLTRDEATIVMEHSQKLKPKADYSDFRMTRNLQHGDSHVSIFQRGGGEN